MNPVVGTVPLKYVLLSLKNASWALVRLRKSVIIAEVYALPFVFENFGIAIAARTPITTTTISNSIRVKPPWDRGLFLARASIPLPGKVAGFPRGKGWGRGSPPPPRRLL